MVQFISRFFFNFDQSGSLFWTKLSSSSGGFDKNKKKGDLISKINKKKKNHTEAYFHLLYGIFHRPQGIVNIIKKYISVKKKKNR